MSKSHKTAKSSLVLNVVSVCRHFHIYFKGDSEHSLNSPLVCKKSFFFQRAVLLGFLFSVGRSLQFSKVKRFNFRTSRLPSRVCWKLVTPTVVWGRWRWRERPRGRTSPGFLTSFETSLKLLETSLKLLWNFIETSLPGFLTSFQTEFFAQNKNLDHSVVAVSGQYCTVEEYIDAKYDLHIFKLGNCYRAMM